MSVRVQGLLKLAILFLCAKAQVVFIDENLLIFLISQLTCEALKKRIVRKLEGLLDHFFRNLALRHSVCWLCSGSVC